MASSGDLLAGRYRLEAPLGAGGMATVHRAHDVLLGRRVAVKILASNIAANPAHRERFGREARAMAGITHPNVVAIHDVGWADEQAGGTPFLVMELVSGGTLAQRLAEQGPLDPPAVAALVEGLASALDALHRAGLVHRDVKPQNILLAPSGPKLADMGVIRAEDMSDPDATALTATGTTPGTLRFLAPEVIVGQAAGPKADAFGLAMVAFEAITGRSPRPAVTLDDIVSAAKRPVMRVSEARPELGTVFDAAFAAGLDLDPHRRLDSLAFAASLRNAVDEKSRGGAVGLIAEHPTRAARDVSAVASLNPTISEPDGDATTIADRPVTAAAGAVRVPTRRSRAEQPSAAGVPVTPLTVAAAGIGLVAILVALLGFGRSPSSPDDRASAFLSQPPPSSLSPSAPASPSPSPPPSPTPDSTAARAALAAIRDISARLGGRAAEDLAKDADDVEEALDEGDLDKAGEKARDLAQRVDELIEEGEIRGRRADALREEARALLDALETQTSGGG